MDWDDLKPKAPKGIVVGEPLAQLSVAELEARIGALEAEIRRTRSELDAKRASQTAAASVFKR
jgi:uncharacterized small protein (DUF1192 family)